MATPATAWSAAVPSIGHFDVVVVGSGSAGSTAAIAASRQGARVLLIEKLPFLGGNSTAVLDTFYGFYSPGSRPFRVVDSIPGEVVEKLRTLGPVIERPNTYGAGTGVTYNADHLKVAWEDLVTSAGTRVLLHSFVQEVKVSDGRVTDLLLATKAGLRQVSATTFVDASGDGDLSHFAGFGYEVAGEIAPAQTLTTTFRMINVDHAARKKLTKEDLRELMLAASAEGYLLPRTDGSDHITPIEGMTATVMTRLDSATRDADGTLQTVLDPENLTKAEMAGRRQVLEYARFLTDKVAGYENSSLVGLSTQIGLRETRRIYGDYRVTREDVLGANQFDDQIALCAAPIEDHHSGDGTAWAYLPEGSAAGIPLRSLIVRDAQNVMVAGRCFSATHDAQASIRSMAQTMAMGQAAGTAAAMAAAAAGGLVRDVPATAIRETLRAAGAILEVQLQPQSAR
ncbi:FAD-dependent oxidoreductase [Paenarthrobacter sp. OM7]|uniref:FAD-dependent oxidoreductase n=1 Tax=Paenarthrobacter sp. OM7 TaxID=3041264 RepID=UPI0024684CBB|nr:FAD-dependent oxidoreductase [Paenarthrobacter sp. OM7]WGM20292.1 FAD-dependent oxidoreductase [Paenarthrobacter sp. OM7]